MTQRITQSSTARLLLGDLSTAVDRLSRTQQKIASGKEITKPSDNPYGTLLAMAMASSKEPQGITDTTGPKISSCAIRIPGSTSANTVAS